MTVRWLLMAALAAGCAVTAPQPVAIDTANDACRHCRMMVSDVHFAAEIVAPGEEPLIFDDVGCLRDYLAEHPLSPDGVVYVADRRTGAWARGDEAVYTQVTTIATPMGSGIVAHADAASRDADPPARNGVRVALAREGPR